MKKSLLGILFIFILVGCGKYVEPKLNNNTSLLILKDGKDGKNTTYIHAKIDNQTIDAYNNSIRKIRVNAGKHTISLDSTIYYDGKAKCREPVNLNIDFKSKNIYTIDLVPQTLKLTKDDNITGTYRIFENKKLILKKDLIFGDRILKSISNNSSSMDTMVIDSIVYQAILSSTL